MYLDHVSFVFEVSSPPIELMSLWFQVNQKIDTCIQPIYVYLGPRSLQSSVIKNLASQLSSALVAVKVLSIWLVIGSQNYLSSAQVPLVSNLGTEIQLYRWVIV